MTKWHRARNYILERHHSGTGQAGRPSRLEVIIADDYRPVPVPPNIPIPIPASCLIWRWGLTNQGYGCLRIRGANELAHRVAYRQGGRELSNSDSVLHACHRRFCVQPAHLYAGSAKDNAVDRLAYNGSMEPDFFREPMPIGYIESGEFGRRLNRDHQAATLFEYHSDRWERMGDAIRYWWPDPEDIPQQLAFGPPSRARCPGHEFTVPAGDVQLCWICHQSNSRIRWHYFNAAHELGQRCRQYQRADSYMPWLADTEAPAPQ